MKPKQQHTHPPTCQYCPEPVLPGEANPNGPRDIHCECLFRIVCGSIAHIEHRCGCYVPGSTENDPPGLSRRNAARLAYRAWLIRADHNLPDQYAK